jgi:predicted PurR-regulated permease PerM
LNRSLHSTLLLLLVFGLILGVTGLLITSLKVVLMVFAGILFGIFLSRISRWVRDHTPLSYRWSLVVVLSTLLLMVGFGVYRMGSQAGQQATKLWAQLQVAAIDLTERLQANPWLQDYLPETSDLQSRLAEGGFLPRLMQGVQWMTWGTTALLVIFFVGLYLAFSPTLYHGGLIRLFPRPQRERATDVLERLHTTLIHWIVGRLISMTLIGVLTGFGMWLLGVPLPVSLGVVAALLTFIPNIGPVLSTLPQALLALNVGTDTVLYVLLFNVALQTLESYLITPVVQRYEVRLPPALTIFAQLLLSLWLGVIGLMMAAPLTAGALVLVERLYLHDYLGEPAEEDETNEH